MTDPQCALRGVGTDWLRCTACQDISYRKKWERGMGRCPMCGHHGRLAARERIGYLVDPGTYTALPGTATATDPLGFVDVIPYRERLARASGDEAVHSGTGRIAGHRCVLAVMDFGFLGGSLGTAAGERVTVAAEHALRHRIPLLLVTASGGARMQEGALSLLQMAKVSQAMAALREAGVLTVSLVTDPTYGGVAASFATQADVILAEPGARLGFAGPRVIRQTIGQELPPGFQTAEYLLDNGLVDMVVPRNRLRAAIGYLLAAAGNTPGGPGPAGGRSPGGAGGKLGGAGFGAGDGAGLDGADLGGGEFGGAGFGAEGGAGPGGEEFGGAGLDGAEFGGAGLGGVGFVAAGLDAWGTVGLARDSGRPSVRDCLDGVFESFLELHGDRLSGDSPTVVAGLARLHGQAVAVVGTQKGHGTAELVASRFGMAGPEGYRKAVRIFGLAERLGIPIVTLVDTPGAYPGTEAEQHGQAMAIAESILRLTSVRVPVVAVVLGEGGSGGALALAVADRVLMCEHAVYSVISPEGCAAILGFPGGAPAAAAALKLTAPDLLELGIVDGIVPEPPGGSAADPAAAMAAVRDAVGAALDEVAADPPDQMVARRRERLRGIGSGVGSSTRVPEGALR